jgi:predicted ATP-grasp superfamily ATP-dependent carboligase
MNESILLSVKGFYLIIASGVLHVVSLVAEATTDVADPTQIIRLLESLGPQGLLLAGIMYLYRANQKLEAEIKKIHDDQEKEREAREAHFQRQLEESNTSRDRLYRAIQKSTGINKDEDE